MSLQLTPFDPYTRRSAATAADLPSVAAAASAVAPAASVATAGMAPGDGSSERDASGSRAGTTPAGPARTATAGDKTGAAATIDLSTVPSTVSLGKAPAPASTAESAGESSTASAEPPVSEQLLEFLHSMWQASANAITSPKEKDDLPWLDALGGVDAAAAATGEKAASSSTAQTTASGTATASAAGERGTEQSAGHPSDARSAAATKSRTGDVPILGNALDDGLPASAAPATAPLVYADPTLRRPSGR